MATFWQRLRFLASSKADKALKSMENPEELVDQGIVAAKHQLADTKQRLADSIAVRDTQARELEALEKSLTDHNSAAKAALIKGDDENARTLLSKATSIENRISTQKSVLETHEKAVEINRKAYDTCAVQLESVKSRSSEVKAMASATKSLNAANAAQGSVDNSAFAYIDEMAERAESEFARANAMSGLNDEAKAEDDMVQMYLSNSNVDDKLAAMKAELGL